MSLKNISRGALDPTINKLAPSSCPSACPSMTTLPRLWATNGCRLNPSLHPVPPHLPAVQVSPTPPHTATAQASTTKNPPAVHCRTPATGLSIKAEMMTDPLGNFKKFFFLHFTVKLPVQATGERWGRATRCRRAATVDVRAFRPNSQWRRQM